MDAPDDWPYPDFDPVATAGERATLVAFLDQQRAAFEARCTGLTAAQLARRSCEPSSVSLLGLLRHMAGVESGWFRTVMGGDDRPRPFSSADDPDHDFNGARADDEQVESAWVTWRAQHNGHADLLRERIDGTTFRED